MTAHIPWPTRECHPFVVCKLRPPYVMLWAPCPPPPPAIATRVVCSVLQTLKNHSNTLLSCFCCKTRRWRSSHSGSQGSPTGNADARKSLLITIDICRNYWHKLPIIIRRERTLGLQFRQELSVSLSFKELLPLSEVDTFLDGRNESRLEQFWMPNIPQGHANRLLGTYNFGWPIFPSDLQVYNNWVVPWVKFVHSKDQAHNRF